MVNFKWMIILLINIVINEMVYLVESKNVFLMKLCDRDLREEGYDKLIVLIDFDMVY